MPKGVLHHLSLEVSDIARAKWFYDRFLTPIGFRRFADDADYLGYTDGGLTVWLLKSRRPRIHRKPPVGDEEVIAEHIAFRLPSAAAVAERAQALQREEIIPFFPPEDHPEFAEGYHSATWADPDGIVLELYAVNRASKRSGGARRKTAARPGRSRAARPARSGRRGRARR